MAITAEFIGVYIAGIIITMATITVIGATITAITAIGETYRVAAVSKTSSPQAQGSQHTLRPFPFLNSAQTRARQIARVGREGRRLTLCDELLLLCSFVALARSL